MRGANKCVWLKIGKTELCGKSCMGEYCSMHNYLIRRGGGTIPCTKCGKGVKTSLALCQGCGVDYARQKIWRNKQRVIVGELRQIISELVKKYKQLGIVDK